VLAPHPELSAYYTDSKRPFVSRMFDHGAVDYDRIERMMAFGSGSWYRRQALTRAGLKQGMRMLDVAVGTGLVAQEAVTLTGSPANVIGVDPSQGMLAQARQRLTIPVILGMGEQLPVADGRFDFVCMGYALRHLADIRAPFREFFRVLKPGGTVCVLEMTPPRKRLGALALRFYMRTLIPNVTRLFSRSKDSPVLWRYFWDTVEACVAPEQVMQALREAGFQNVRRHVEIGIFSEYTAQKPA
jgi:demethylmenaquinone methyltransferase / 2-methoxy-6-polyprenyl-1,4-benzoquinol methylase